MSGATGTPASPKEPARRKAGKKARKRKPVTASRVKTAKGLSRTLTHRIILGGVSAALVKAAVDHDVLALDEVYRFIPKSTFARKVRDNTTLSVEEGDRIARLARLKSYAADVFDSEEDAGIWLSENNPALSGEAPIDLLLTDEGARRVETVLRRIDYGDYT
jgi:putative toxin-antitoxin system antitoxin component (TIGR02293 family)